ncbi:mycofactocin oligosaccharide methyltransferase MftM [Nocardioides jiangxiensis]|uniref:Mycofactocin oligosaccharide methyltransferase MftM n=1 Tax=Nocardioides jiangxiensis TaxID=3064524 RepID=A0ABT9B589_9ACTN|nr:mycofactocin oligosaccharide methyltransferase MftM [Nocardioides sp. WY-20]MDO7868471.1 mycofactocin oligosaccharide methyltransferase MftM [Nocardioides sp. WY-20]
MTLAAPIDPLPAGARGVYADDLVEVVRTREVPPGAVRTVSFAFWTDHDRVHLAHDLPPARIDNDLAGLVAAELFAPGWLEGSELFERLMTGLVVSSADDALTAWTLFYRNTLDRLAGLTHGSVPRAAVPPASDLVEGSLAGYAPVYAHAAGLIEPGSVLELGSCFGFFSLFAADRFDVTASDLSANTVRLLARVAPLLGRTIDTVICDAARVPRPSRSYDTVVALHLLEHLPVEHGVAVLREMQRLARRRVVVAVPFEDEPTAAYGHVRVFTSRTLVEMADASGWWWTVHEHHGGWLVLDRP